MKFTPLEIPGVYLIELEKLCDHRGFFARTTSLEEFRRHGLEGSFVECSVSFNERRGTWRGLHFQAPPHEEEKVVRCTKGSVIDFVLDVRENSPTLGRHLSIEISANNHRSLYIPKGCAHGFQTLEDQTELYYQISHVFSPDHARGYRYNDPALQLTLPLEVTVISDKDLSFPDFPS